MNDLSKFIIMTYYWLHDYCVSMGQFMGNLFMSHENRDQYIQKLNQIKKNIRTERVDALRESIVAKQMFEALEERQKALEIRENQLFEREQAFLTREKRKEHVDNIINILADNQDSEKDRKEHIENIRNTLRNINEETPPPTPSPSPEPYKPGLKRATITDETEINPFYQQRLEAYIEAHTVRQSRNLKDMRRYQQ